LLQQLWRDHVIGVTGDGALRRQRNPDAADHDRQTAILSLEITMYPA
jgi:hypothetical protein